MNVSASWKLPLYLMFVAGVGWVGDITAAVPPVSASRLELPAIFEENQGQFEQTVKYLTRGSGYTVFMTTNSVAFSLKDGNKTAPLHYQLAFLGSNTSPVIRGRKRAQTQLNYLKGQDSARWVTGAAAYHEVSYQELYPGVDLLFYGNGQRGIEYDFVLKPRADISQIQLEYTGVDEIGLDRQGNLQLTLKGQQILQQAPLMYQWQGDSKVPVAGRYQLAADQHSVSFVADNYDHNRELIIDPVIIYSTYLGAPGDASRDILVDADGNAWITGYTTSTDFPVVNGAQSSHGGAIDVFIAKLNSDGSALDYATYLGGSDDEVSGGSIGPAMAIDRSGNILITGRTLSQDFPIVNALQPLMAGDSDFFVTKLSPDGSRILWSTYLGGSATGQVPPESAPTIATDFQGNAFIMGYSSVAGFPMVNALQPEPAGAIDTIVAKIAADGSELLFSTYLGGSNSDKGRGMTTDTEGNVYIVGRTDSVDFPTASPLQASQAGRGDIFITKMAGDGSALLFSSYLGGSNTDKGRAVKVDSLGNIYVTGNTQSDNFPVRNPAQATLAGSGDAFAVKISSGTPQVVFATYLGGAAEDLGAALALDSRSNVYITGYTLSDDFPVFRSLQPTLNGEQDAFVAQLTSRGNRFGSVSYLGGSGDDEGTAIALDRDGNVFVVGDSNSQDFPLQVPFQVEAGGIFVYKGNLR